MNPQPEVKNSQIEDRLSELAERFVKEHREGRRPTIEAYARQHSDLAPRIRQLFPTLMIVEALGPPLEQESLAASPAGDASIPARIGDYRIVREIGRGGMGIVFEAEQISLCRPVALKVLGPRASPDGRLIERFQIEARSAGRLHHPRIIPVYDVGEADGFHYYAMQRIDGSGLDHVLTEIRTARGPAGNLTTVTVGGVATEAEHREVSVVRAIGLDGQDVSGEMPVGATPWSSLAESHPQQYYREIARIGRHVADSLAYAHSEGILHRDIKPSNLILDRQGEIWVADFGLAKAFDSPEPGCLTATGDIVGTMRYMAPERFRGWSDPRSDIYGLGITLYELLTLQPAFDSEDRVVLMDQVQRQVPRALRQVERRIPRDLETIVAKAIQKEPAGRYTTAAELASDLDSFLGCRLIQARRASYSDRARQWCRRNPVVAALSAVLLCVVLGAWATTFYLWRRSEAANKQAQANLGIAQSINDFLLRDLLGQSDIGTQPTGSERNGNITVRELLDRAARGIEHRFAGQEPTEAAIRMTLGNSYEALAEYAESHKQFQRAYDLRSRSLGADHEATLEALVALGYLYLEQEDYDQAERLLTRSLRGFQARFGFNDLHTVNVRIILARLDQDRGRFQQAEHALRDSLKALETMPAGQEALILSTKSLLASVLDGLNKRGEAESLRREVLEQRRLLLGSDHPDTLIAMANLAELYCRQGRLKEALELLEQARDINLAKLGTDHPHTLESISKLAIVYLNMGQLDRAEPLMRTTLQKKQAAHGPTHSATLFAANNLATLYMYQGQFAKAEPLLRQVVQGMEKSHGDNHPDTLVLRSNLASCYLELARYEEAEPIYRQVLESRREQFGDNHLDTLRSLNDVANVLNARKRFTEAEPLFRKVYEGRLAQLGGEHAETLISLNNVAMIAKSLGKLDKAETIYKQALDGRRKSLGEDHPDTLRTLNQLGELLMARERMDEAEPLLQSAVDGARKRLGMKHPQTQVYLGSLAELYTRKGQTAQAEPLLRTRDEAASAGKKGMKE